MAGGALDAAVARIEAYFGEFLGTRADLLEAKRKIEFAMSQAGTTGTSKIGEKTFTYPQLQSLLNENTNLLNQNADLQTKVMEFKDQVAAAQAAVESGMDTLVANPDADYPWFDMPGLLGDQSMGALPAVAIPAAYLIGAGAVLATTLYLFISNVRSHLGSVAGDIGSNLILYGGVALLGAWFAHKKGWI